MHINQTKTEFPFFPFGRYIEFYVKIQEKLELQCDRYSQIAVTQFRIYKGRSALLKIQILGNGDSEYLILTFINTDGIA